MINFLKRVSRPPRILQLRIFVALLCTLTVGTILASSWFLGGELVTLYTTLCILLCSNIVLVYICIQVSLGESKRRRESEARIEESLSTLAATRANTEEYVSAIGGQRDAQVLHSAVSSLSNEVRQAQERGEHLHSLTRKRIRSKFADMGVRLSKETSKVARDLQHHRTDLQSVKRNQAEVIDTLRDVSLQLTNQRETRGPQRLEIQAAFLALLEELRPIGDNDQADMEGSPKA